MEKIAILIACLSFLGCDTPSQNKTIVKSIPKDNCLVAAKEIFETKIIGNKESGEPPETPTGGLYDLIKYESSVGPLSAYVSKNPGDGKKHPAIVWITGGDNNSIGDVWSEQPRSNDQSVSAFRKAGIIVMFPSQRGGNDNPGQREGFFREVDDILNATDYLVSLPYVDENNIYLGGHSTGGTLAMLVGASSIRYRGIISLGPVASPIQYGDQYLYWDKDDENEVRLRSPIDWMHCIKTPMFVIEGKDGNWNGAIKLMVEANTNKQIKFFKAPNHDHFSAIAPVVEVFAKQISKGQISITPKLINSLK